MYCTNCGKELSYDTKFCPGCGAGLTAVDTTVPYNANVVSKNAVIEHLEYAKIFETRIYTLDCMINKLKEKIQELRTAPAEQKQLKDSYDFSAISLFWIFFAITLLIFIFTSKSPIETILCIISVILIFFSDEILGMLLGSAGIAFGICIVIQIFMWLKVFIDNRTYTRNYKARVLSDKQEYERNLRQANILEKEQTKAEIKKKEAQRYLNEIYKANILAPKYRNMTAVLTIYEYFIYGRCDELTGHEGAYNLYESELRMGIIINSLSEIITRLEAIQQNQYMIYNAIKQTQSIMDSLWYSMQNMSDNINSIANNSEISSYYSRMSAEDTRVLTYINLMK